MYTYINVRIISRFPKRELERSYFIIERNIVNAVLLLCKHP